MLHALMHCSLPTQLCRTYTSTFQGYQQFDLMYKGSNDKIQRPPFFIYCSRFVSSTATNLTRWGTWLEASFLYAENFEIAKQIVSSFENGGKLVEQAKEAIADQDVFSKLRQIFSNYREIAVLIKEIINSSNTIVAAVEAIQNLCFNDDPCQIKQYIQKRLAAGSDILKIVDGSAVKLPEHSPAKVPQPTSASVKRYFSILKNLL